MHLHFRFHKTALPGRATPRGAKERKNEQCKRAKMRDKRWPCVRRKRKEKKRRRREDSREREEACNRSLQPFASSPLWPLHVGAHPRGETGGRIVEHGGREEEEREKEEEEGGGGGEMKRRRPWASGLALLFFSGRLKKRNHFRPATVLGTF